MTGERKPSIYVVDNDESIVESSRELDKYGVWVKIAPQILSPLDSASQESLIQSIPDKEENGLSDLLQESDTKAPVEDTSEEGTSLEHPPINPIEIEEINTSYSSKGKTLDNLSIPNAENVPVSDQKALTDKGSEETFSYPLDELKEPAPPTEDIIDTSTENPQDQASKPQDETPSLQPLSSEIPIQLLTKIIEELSLIRNDIASIKQVLARLEVSEGRRVETEIGVTFNEEEEKITLTGNELNNILNAPDFTDPVDVLAEEELSIDDLNFLQGDSLAFESLPSEDKALDIPEKVIAPLDHHGETFIDLADTEEFRRLREEGDKPIGEMPNEIEALEADPFEEDFFDFDEAPVEKSSGGAISSGNSSDDILIDNLLIESGTIKDIPIELDLDEEDSNNEEELNFDREADAELPNLKESAIEPFDLSTFFDEEVDISDEELDRIEKNILQEFSIRDDFLIDHDFSMEALEAVEGVDRDLEGATEAAKKNKTSDKIEISFNLREGLKTVLSYMDRLLESLPDNKIDEFVKSEYFDTYKKLFHTLGLG
jgi:hypothetical protein